MPFPHPQSSECTEEQAWGIPLILPFPLVVLSSQILPNRQLPEWYFM